MNIRLLLSNPATLSLLRIGGAGIGFLTQIFLARVLGPHDLGIFYSATSLAAIAGFVASLGYSQIAFRFASRYGGLARQHLLSAFATRASIDGLVVAIAIAIAIIVLSAVLPGIETKSRASYALAGVTVVATTAMTLYTNIAGAVRMFGWCYIPDGIARPVVFLAAIALLALFADRVTTVEVTSLFALITIGFALVVVPAVMRALPKFKVPAHSARRLAWRWRKEALFLVLLSLYTNSFADIGILFATPFLASADIAVFGICLKLSLLVGYFIQIAQQMAVPDLADARRNSDVVGMRKAVRRSLPLPILITVMATAVCALIGDRILDLFGPHFAHGRDVLIVLLACQIVRALAGPSAHLIILNGAQRLNAALCVGALAVLLVANALLAPIYGPLGAALAVFLSYTSWIVATGVALNRLGEIRTDVLALLMPRQPSLR